MEVNIDEEITRVMSPLALEGGSVGDAVLGSSSSSSFALASRSSSLLGAVDGREVFSAVDAQRRGDIEQVWDARRRPPVCCSCTGLLRPDDTFCSWCGYGVHCDSRCAILVSPEPNGDRFPVCVRCYGPVCEHIAEAQAAQFAVDMQRRREEWAAPARSHAVG